MYRAAQLLIMALFLAGCFGAKTEIASWYYMPPRDNALSLYGVGEGFDANEAKKMALSHIAENLSISLQSSYVKTDASMRYNGREQTLQDARHTITTQAQSLRFGAVATEKEQVIDSRVYLLVSVERAALYAEQKDELEEKIQNYRRQFDAMKDATALEQFIVLHRFHKEADALQSHAALLYAIDSRKSISPYSDFIAQNESAYLKARNTLRVNVQSDASSSSFKAPLEHELGAIGVKISDTASDGTLKISSQSKQEYLLGFYVEKCFLHVDLFDAKNSLIAAKQHILSGKSKIDFSQSHHNCVAKFAVKVADEGIFESLGI